MKKFNILITGSNGQLGNEIQNIAKNYKHFNFLFTDVNELNITNYNDVKNFVTENNINFIINSAAYTAVDRAEEEKELAYKINATGAKNLKNIAEQTDIPIIHISTDYVFNGKNHKPYTETDATKPESEYGFSKLEGERVFDDYKKSIIIRTSWLYSVYGNNFVKTIIKIASENDQIKVVFDQIGTPTNAADLAKAILEITSQTLKSDKVQHGIYHYSNEGACSWYDFAISIINAKKINCTVNAVSSDEFPRPAKRPFYSVLNKTKIKSTFDIKIPHWHKSLLNAIDKM